MIRANELRIGNYVNNDDFVIPFCEIIASDIVAASQCEIAKTSTGLHGIPLTTEWLTKFGFQKDHDGLFKRNNCLYWLDNGYLQIAIGYSPVMNCPCNYVHQLQNLIFALTGEELTVKEGGV